MKKLGSVLALCAVASAFCATVPNTAEARPAYANAFNEKYAKSNEKLKEQVTELKCGVCHGEGGKNKKVVSDYGKAFAESLGEKNKNTKSSEIINKALTEIEAKKEGDKTYGELLKAGVLPKLAEAKK